MIKSFTVYRPNIPEGTHTETQANEKDKPQFEGIIFSDGTTVIHWCTKHGSTSIFKTFQELMDIHGHPEYGTYFVWEG